MASEIKVNTIKDLGGNTIVTSNGSGTISGLPASAISSGTVATARLGSGTASSSTFLAGDQSYKTVSGTTINNNANNKVITGSGTANTLEGEANLTYNGTILGVGASADLGTGVHIKRGDSGATANGNADQLVLENADAINSGNTGMSFLGSGNARICFGDAADDDVGRIMYSQGSNYMNFKTNATEAVRIHSNQVVSAVAGIALGVGTANTASNVLDDYEEGTFTPVLGGGGGTSNQSYGLQGGNYVKIGNRVFIDANASLSAKGTITGGLQIQGLPFTCKAGSAAYRASASHSYIFKWSLSSGETMINSTINENIAHINVGESDVTGNEAWSQLTTTQVNNASELFTSINYRVA